MAQQVRSVGDADGMMAPYRVPVPVFRPGPSLAEMSQPIPAAVLQLLGQAWQRTGGVSEFEQGFVQQPAAGVGCYEHSGTGSCPDSAFSRQEIEDLLEAGVFAGLTHGPLQHCTVDAHAEHALADFCAEVYDAWDRLQGRLEAARAVAARMARTDVARD